MKKFIYIEWEDVIQFSRTGWKDQEDATKETKEESFIVQQVGWIVNQDENYIVLANLIRQGSENLFSEFTKIPKALIRFKKIIPVPKKGISGLY